jgi:hypothetical protein
MWKWLKLSWFHGMKIWYSPGSDCRPSSLQISWVGPRSTRPWCESSLFRGGCGGSSGDLGTSDAFLMIPLVSPPKRLRGIPTSSTNIHHPILCNFQCSECGPSALSTGGWSGDPGFASCQFESIQDMVGLSFALILFECLSLNNC